MTASTSKKRLAEVETGLTPKEWAIRLADAMRAHPSKADFLLAAASKSFQDSPISRPFHALADQAEARNPGNKPDEIRARNKLHRALDTEYYGLKFLIFDINEVVQSEAKSAGLQAALKLARLEIIVLQDAFGRTARKAAEWVEEYKTADAAEEESRQGMLNELAAYTGIDYGEKWSDSVPILEGIRFRVPSIIEDWVTEVVALASNVFAHQAAVQIIQNKYFAGHAILFRDVEAGLDSAIKTLEEGASTFNHYLKTRLELFQTEWEAEAEEDDGIASAIPGELEGRLAIDIAAIRAGSKKIHANVIGDKWVKNATKIANASGIKDGILSWEIYREMVGTELGGIKP